MENVSTLAIGDPQKVQKRKLNQDIATITSNRFLNSEDHKQFQQIFNVKVSSRYRLYHVRFDGLNYQPILSMKIMENPQKTVRNYQCLSAIESTKSIKTINVEQCIVKAIAEYATGS
eukprot:188140_1